MQSFIYLKIIKKCKLTHHKTTTSWRRLRWNVNVWHDTMFIRSARSGILESIGFFVVL
ncbi:hypothetical protein OIU77_018257 [Salix suchowensis]|uniref:Uncharacterized protein n=1 Tax=Salix suchowensis TaxID=1278906 RepID=A0ABQ8ZRL1_9ROSI|nr:hypothetical protein OIU77_018257 [Salix suchowensis]